MAENDREENVDTSAMQGFVIDEEATDVDVVASDGQTIRHRMVYVKDQFRPTAYDLRIHALQQANASYGQDRSSWRRDSDDEPAPDVAESVLDIAKQYLDFLQGGSA